MVVMLTTVLLLLIRRLFLVIMLATPLGLVAIGFLEEGYYGSKMLVIDLVWFESMVLDV